MTEMEVKAVAGQLPFSCRSVAVQLPFSHRNTR
jgi:hypothetical protein